MPKCSLAMVPKCSLAMVGCCTHSWAMVCYCTIKVALKSVMQELHCILKSRCNLKDQYIRTIPLLVVALVLNLA